MQNVSLYTNSPNMQIQTEKKSEPKKSILGVIAGTIGGSFVNSGMKAPIQSIPNYMQNIGKSLTNDEFKAIREGSLKALEKSNLANKGVEILTINHSNIFDVSRKCTEEMLKKIKIKSDMMPDIIENFMQTACSQVAQGKNAFFNPKVNKILVGENKELSATVFHEMGHAMNTNFSKLGKILQKTRGLNVVAVPIIAITSVLHRNKYDEYGEQSKLNKAGEFIKKHSGVLTALSWAPTILEEGMASLKGGKLAKELLDKSLVKKINKTNALGFASYVLCAAASIAGIKVATAISDKITEKKHQKKLQKLMAKNDAENTINIRINLQKT